MVQQDKNREQMIPRTRIAMVTKCPREGSSGQRSAAGCWSHLYSAPR